MLVGRRVEADGRKMPPKKESNKNVEKKAQKIVEDKTCSFPSASRLVRPAPN